jgi:hypothetical protein
MTQGSSRRPARTGALTRLLVLGARRPADDRESIWPMLADQVVKIGGVDATLDSFADRRQIDAGDEVALYQEIGV